MAAKSNVPPRFAVENTAVRMRLAARRRGLDDATSVGRPRRPARDRRARSVERMIERCYDDDRADGDSIADIR
jgi:hypothetical protein